MARSQRSCRREGVEVEVVWIGPLYRGSARRFVPVSEVFRRRAGGCRGTWREKTSRDLTRVPPKAFERISL